MSEDEGRPDQAAFQKLGGDQDFKFTLATADARNADRMLTAAWLRVHAWRLHDLGIDPSGQLFAHLLDHADCYEPMAGGRR